MRLATTEARTPWDTEPNHEFVAGDDRTQLWRGGLNHDVVCIIRNGKQVVFDAIRDGEIRLPVGDFLSVVFGVDVIAVGHGTSVKDQPDLLTIYGLWNPTGTDNWKAEICYFPGRDGRIIDLQVVSRDIGNNRIKELVTITYGHNRDRHRTFCWRGWDRIQWRESLQDGNACDYAVPHGTTLSTRLPPSDKRAIPANSPRLIAPRV